MPSSFQPFSSLSPLLLFPSFSSNFLSDFFQMLHVKFDYNALMYFHTSNKDNSETRNDPAPPSRPPKPKCGDCILQAWLYIPSTGYNSRCIFDLDHSCEAKKINILASLKFGVLILLRHLTLKSTNTFQRKQFQAYRIT